MAKQSDRNQMELAYRQGPPGELLTTDLSKPGSPDGVRAMCMWRCPCGLEYADPVPGMRCGCGVQMAQRRTG